jgi:hypothetical protein
MALLSVCLAAFLAGTGYGSAPGGVAEAGHLSTPVLCVSTFAGVGSEEEEEQVDLRKVGQIPRVWIGIRVSTVPDALAAHIKQGTLMIVNVAEGSPADQAGIDRYDVILSVNDRGIVEMQDLLDAICENGADQPAQIVVIKGGQQQTVAVKPIQRDLTIAPTFKYEEQEVAQVDPLRKYFGHRLKVGPDGNVVVIPHGRLDGLPDDIKSLLDEIPDMSIDLGDEDSTSLWFFGDEPESSDTRVITITVDDNGQSTTIQRDRNGKFTVEREDADGNRTSATYDDVDALREGDPEAYKIYRRSALRRSFSAIVLPPDLTDLGHWQRDFEVELKTKIAQAHRKAEQAVKDEMRRVEIQHQKTEADDGSETHTKSVTLSVKDGRIMLTITEDGVTRKYAFDSREQFEAAEPELYREYESYLD